MKKYFVYELINLVGTVEYVGETTNSKARYNHHVCKDGKFPNRKDLILNIVTSFNTKKEAFNYQCELQTKYGFETDREIFRKASLNKPTLTDEIRSLGGKVSNKIVQSRIHTCKCGKIGKGNKMIYHIKNCK